MPKVTKHAWTNNPKAQVQLAKAGSSEFSHTTDLPLSVSVVKPGWFCGQKIIVRTLEDVWYLDAVSRIEIPMGFTCDLASIPTPLWWIVSPLSLAMEGLFHDQNYREQKVSRQYADFLMLHMMALRGVPWWIRYPVWLAVRMFGGKAWRTRTEQMRRRERAELVKRTNASKFRIRVERDKDA